MKRIHLEFFSECSKPRNKIMYFLFFKSHPGVVTKRRRQRVTLKPGAEQASGAERGASTVLTEKQAQL